MTAVDDFRTGLIKLLNDEAERIEDGRRRQQQAEAEDRQRRETIAAQRVQIADHLRHVTSIWNPLVGEINALSSRLGFSADISGHSDDHQQELQVNFHVHDRSLGIALLPLTLTVGDNGIGSFSPSRASAFDFLRAHETVFTHNLAEHVRDMFTLLGNRHHGL